MKYQVNWIETPQGNGIKEGDILKVKCEGAAYFNAVVYKDDLPVLIAYTRKGKDEASIIVKRTDISLKGTALLKVRGFDPKFRGFGFNDEFEIV